jgi:murein DD-endopeptidase MepM/ murein hydrolase activator NlpD
MALEGPMTQGGMILGRVAPGAAVSLDGEPVRVAADGRFVFGFGRDAPAEAVLEVTAPDGGVTRQRLPVAPREYDVQRIDGLPPAKVTPPPELAERLRRERAAVAAARRPDGAALHWAEGFAWPARGRVSGVYGSQRILNGEPRQPHYGLDIAAPAGTEVVAPAGGTVTLAERDFYYEGGIVVIDHGHGVSSTLFHLQSVEVRAGEEVAKGRRIGALGATGRASGAHVDWRVNWRTVRLDPGLLVGPPPAD